MANGDVTLARTGIDTRYDARVASEPNDYRLNEDCEYDADMPSNTPFALGNTPFTLDNPVRPADVFIDANPVDVGYPEPNSPEDIYEPGDVRLAHRASSGAMARIRFYFYAEDAYSAEHERARVASGEDSAWAALREIAVRDELGQVWIPASTTTVFRGEVRVSTSRDALMPGDDRIFVRSPDDDLQVHYHSAIGEADSAIGEAGKPKRSARAPRRRVSVEFANAPREHGDIVVFYISDRYLGTTRPCAAVWENTPGAAVGVQTYWRLADGAPFPEVFTLEGDNCAYDPATPIILAEHGAAIMTQQDGQTKMRKIISLDDPNWRISFFNEVPAGSALRVMFRQTLPDVFPASARIAHVYSSSDRAGEWVAIREVVSKTDASAAGASHLFRGEIEISAHESSRAPGDGKVFVRRTSRLWVAYHDIYNAEIELGRKSQPLALLIPTPTPTPVPTPIPATSRLTLALAAAAFSALTAYALLARARRNQAR